jgi:hypothetical protein
MFTMPMILFGGLLFDPKISPPLLGWLKEVRKAPSHLTHRHTHTHTLRTALAETPTHSNTYTHAPNTHPRVHTHTHAQVSVIRWAFSGTLANFCSTPGHASHGACTFWTPFVGADPHGFVKDVTRIIMLIVGFRMIAYAIIAVRVNFRINS